MFQIKLIWFETCNTTFRLITRINQIIFATANIQRHKFRFKKGPKLVYFFCLQKIVWSFPLGPLLCLIKNTQIAVWSLWFLKPSLDQLWIESAIVPTASWIVWQWYRIFNITAVETSLPKGAIRNMGDASWSKLHCWWWR